MANAMNSSSATMSPLSQNNKTSSPARSSNNANVVKRYTHKPNSQPRSHLIIQQPPIRTHDPHDVPDSRHLRLPLRYRHDQVVSHRRRPQRYTLRKPHLQTHPRLSTQLSIRSTRSPLQDSNLPPQRRHERTDMSGYSEASWAREGGCVERGAEYGKCVVEYTESAGRAE
jgi:hypothetical protein